MRPLYGRVRHLHSGFLTSLYLIGSIALNDFHSGRSDIDFVAVTREPVSLADAVVAHASLGGRKGEIFFDGLYVTAEELQILPGEASRGVVVINGVLLPDSCVERHAVTWLTLVRHGITIRDPMPAPSWIAADLNAAQAYSRENLGRYWRGWIRLHQATPNRPLSVDAATWSVLGISRLYALIAEGLVLSKTDAGLYALAAFLRHRLVIEEAPAVRAGGTNSAGGTAEDSNATFAFLAEIIAMLAPGNGVAFPITES